MSTKKYVLGTAVLLLVLISGASALVVNDTQTITSLTFKMSSVVADAYTPKATLRVDPLGNITIHDHVVFNHKEPADPNDTLIMNGGICNMTGYTEFPTTNGPVEIWINSGTLTVHEFVNTAYMPYRTGTIWIGGGNMIVQTGYLTGDPDKDPNKWEANGTMKPQTGYTISYENLGGGAVRIYGIPLLYNPTPAHLSDICDLYLPSLKWDTLGVKVCKVWFKQAIANKDNYTTVLNYIDQTGVLNPAGDSVTFALTGRSPALLPLTGIPSGNWYTWAVEGYQDVVGGVPTNKLGVAVYYFKVTTKPIIRTQPQHQYKNAGETAVFTAEVESYTALTAWDWRKNGTPITGGTKTDLGNNRYQLTLTIPTVGWDSQAVYQCTVTNAAGLSVYPSANLVVKTLVAHWNFNGNLLDTAPKTVHTIVYNGTAIGGTPSYVASGGIDPNALSFDGSMYVQLPAGFKDFKTGVTISVWAWADAAMVNDLDRKKFRFVDFAQQAGDSDYLYSVNFCRYGTDPQFYRGLVFRGLNSQRVMDVIKFNQWRHYLVTMDVLGNAKFYVDGYPIASAFVDVPITAVRDLNYIGEANVTGLTHSGKYFIGKMGDLRIYNYAISADDVKNLYAGLYGSFCDNRPDWDIDKTGASNCIVNTADLLKFASQWLDCGLWPVTACP
jgi:hypothetical protein